MNSSTKILLIIIGFLVLLFGGCHLFLHIAFDGIFTGPFYDKKGLIANYEQKEKSIIKLKNYVESITPPDVFVHIEFDDDELSIFHVKANNNYESNWRSTLSPDKIDSLLIQIGWTKDELNTIKTSLEKANCISVANRDPFTIGWQRSGMGKYSYKIFEENLTDSLIKEYNDGCFYSFYKKNIVLEYGGGAIGPQCFPEYKSPSQSQQTNGH